MTHHTDLSAEEPSERAATGPQLRVIRWSWKAKVKALGGASVEAESEVHAPSGGAIETAVAAFLLLLGGVVLAGSLAAILNATSMAGWLIGLIALAVLVASSVAATVVVFHKGSKP